jgi:hypothetical protein
MRNRASYYIFAVEEVIPGAVTYESVLPIKALAVPAAAGKIVGR